VSTTSAPSSSSPDPGRADGHARSSPRCATELLRLNHYGQRFLSYGRPRVWRCAPAAVDETLTRCCRSCRRRRAIKRIEIVRRVPSDLPFSWRTRRSEDLFPERGGSMPCRPRLPGAPHDRGQSVAEHREQGGVDRVQRHRCGIPQPDLERIFEPTSRRARPGWAGLAITQRKSSRTRGEIRVDSAPDGGTTFRIDLPLRGPGRGGLQGRGLTADRREGSAV